MFDSGVVEFNIALQYMYNVQPTVLMNETLCTMLRTNSQPSLLQYHLTVVTLVSLL